MRLDQKRVKKGVEWGLSFSLGIFWKYNKNTIGILLKGII
jgi:hypothetical protein